jgi:hypothetical protein
MQISKERKIIISLIFAFIFTLIVGEILFFPPFGMMDLQYYISIPITIILFICFFGGIYWRLGLLEKGTEYLKSRKR